MKYTGELYGKIGRRYVPLTTTSEEVDQMERERDELRLSINAERAAGANQMLVIECLKGERDELQQWKDSTLKIESAWSAQAVGKLLGITLGTAIHPQIQPAIEKLLADKDRIDWLADPDNTSGNVQLPVGAVMENVDSLRAAIDAAMSGNYEKNMPMVEPGYSSRP